MSNFPTISFHVIFVAICTWVSAFLLIDIRSKSNLLCLRLNTLRPSPKLYPLCIYLSLFSSMLYLPTPGEQVRSLVKSDFIP